MLLATLWATTTSTKAATHSDSYWFLILIFGAYFCFWYFYLRPRWKRNRQVRQTGTKYDVGDKVQTIGGLIGTVSRLDDRTVTIRTDSGVSLDFVRAAISGRHQPPPAPDPEADAATSTGDSA
jgi:preprotein translocase subunit YajC